MRNRHIPGLIPLICSLLLCGCGQTGPLYLPEPEQEQHQEPSQGNGETDTSPAPGS